MNILNTKTYHCLNGDTGIECISKNAAIVKRLTCGGWRFSVRLLFQSVIMFGEGNKNLIEMCFKLCHQKVTWNVLVLNSKKKNHFMYV